MLVLDSLEDPQNVGTLLRSAEAAGVHGVVFPTHRQAPLTPVGDEGSAGAVEHLLLAPVDDLPGALADLHVRGLRIVGAEAEAPLTAREADLRGPLAIVVGSEGQGLGPAVRRRCDLFVRIPMRGVVGSLNAAVAGSILLFEAVAQRDPMGDPTRRAGRRCPGRRRPRSDPGHSRRPGRRRTRSRQPALRQRRSPRTAAATKPPTTSTGPRGRRKPTSTRQPTRRRTTRPTDGQGRQPRSRRTRKATAPEAVRSRRSRRAPEPDQHRTAASPERRDPPSHGRSARAAAQRVAEGRLDARRSGPGRHPPRLTHRAGRPYHLPAPNGSSCGMALPVAPM